MDHIIPTGRFAGRRLDSLDAEERRAILRTRQMSLATTRDLVRGGRAAPPMPGPVPEAALPLVIYRQPRPLAVHRPQRPDEAMTWRVPGINFVWSWKFVAYVLVLLFMFPPLARMPGWVVGWMLRALALRCREIATHFLGSIFDQVGDLASDAVEWAESFVWAGPVDGKQPAGQKLLTLGLGLFALRSIRLWG